MTQHTYKLCSLYLSIVNLKKEKRKKMLYTTPIILDYTSTCVPVGTV